MATFFRFKQSGAAPGRNYVNTGLHTLLAIICFTVFAPAAAAQFSVGGARAAGLGSAATALGNEAWHAGNVATWGTVDRASLAMFASQPFGMAELRVAAGNIVIPTSVVSAGLGAQTFGFELYREIRIAAGFARSFPGKSEPIMHAGALLQHYHISIQGYGSAGTTGLVLGVIFELSPAVAVGFHATNLNRPKLAGREELPLTLAAGLSWRPLSNVLMIADVIQEDSFLPIFRGGLEFEPTDAVALRTGVTTELTVFSSDVGTQTTRLTLGTGFTMRAVTVNLAAERHQLLGWTPAVGLELSI